MSHPANHRSTNPNMPIVEDSPAYECADGSLDRSVEQVKLQAEGYANLAQALRDYELPEPRTYECDFCGQYFEADYLRDYRKDVDGSQGDVCIKCVKHGVLERYVPKGM